MKKRLDQYLVELQLFDSREKAKRMILAGQVLVDDKIIDKPGTSIKVDQKIRVKSQPKYVSRGGDKLESVFKSVQFEIKNLKFMDVGSSTGGFTDFLLQNGANFVYAIDVGTNQLAWKLRNDSRVLSLEKTHIKHLQKEAILNQVDGFVIDVSFISLQTVLPLLPKFAKASHFIVPMMKPQFEVGKDFVGKHGVVKDEKAIYSAILRTWNKLESLSYGIKKLDFSKVAGPKGNVEYFFYAQMNQSSVHKSLIDEIIQQRQKYFSK
ncbi:MAG: TlyA family rRNA (cytidine-2'-O)-methyltransferase [Candidatus Cloacimonadota bacterium]|nr:MAG: TlyA family rRNA (cytidine-2'-O)-methyltransferase [Candidatus Cloacimonadota bacterium]